MVFNDYTDLSTRIKIKCLWYEHRNNDIINYKTFNKTESIEFIKVNCMININFYS